MPEIETISQAKEPLFRMVVTHVHAMLGGGRKANRGDIIEVTAQMRKSLLFTQGAKDA